MSNHVTLECACGQVKGTLQVVPHAYFHANCMCCDCQDFAAYLNNSEGLLDEHGGTELFQTYPCFMKINQGQANIAGVQLKPKGLYRWYTSCCQTPVANTMTSAKIPFIGVAVKLMKFSDDRDGERAKLQMLGPVTLKAFGKYAIGKIPAGAHERFPLFFLPKIMRFMFKGFVSRKYRPSPFFTGKEPIATIKILNAN